MVLCHKCHYDLNIRAQARKRKYGVSTENVFVMYVCNITKIRTNRTISLNKMFFNEKLNIIKNPFTWNLEDPCRAQLFDISSISLNDGLYS